MLKDLRFELSFDDPRLPAEKRIVVRGDRAQLDLLYQAVTDYVQNFLQQSSDWLNERFLPVPTIDRHSDLTSDLTPMSRSGSWQRDSAIPYLQETTHRQPGVIYLKPRGLVAHDLILGPLATAESGSWISLGAIQLFDLAAALDEYAAEAMVLPDLEIDRPQVRPVVWTGVGAAAALLIVGLTSTFLRFKDTTETTASAPVVGKTQSPSPIPPLAPIPVPTEGPPPPLSSRQSTPTPTPTSTPTPTPEASLTPPAPAPKLEAPKEVNPTPIPIPSDAPTAQTTPEAKSGQSLIIPGGAAPAQPQPQPQPQSPPPSPPPTLDPIEVAPEPPPFRPPITAAPDAGLPTTLPTLPPAVGTRFGSRNDGASARGGEDLATAARSSPRREGSNDLNLLEEEAESPPSAFEVTPQVREVKTYFQDRWQPPEGLTLTLEYTLVLKEDGSLQEAIPLGHTAEHYLDRTGIPLPGSPITSPVGSGQQPQIRLVLGADGEVNTFLER